jgi:hypothetical protein
MELAGMTYAAIADGRIRFERALAASDKANLLKVSEQGLIRFLDDLSENDIFERYFAYRCRTITESVHKFSKTVKSFDGITFGTNAYSPIGARIVGQNYNEYDGIYDYLQPLLGYTEWHIYEPIAAWGRYLCRHAGLNEAVAVEIAKRLFCLGDTICPDNFAELDSAGEGNDRSAHSMFSAELKMCEEFTARPYKITPIIRGKTWSKTFTDDVIHEIGQSPFNAYVFQGPDYLLKGIPHSIKWNL